MKKLLISLFTTLCIYSCTPSSYTIDATADNQALNGTKVFIKERINREWISLDSSIIKKGMFSFKGNCDSARIAFIEYEFPAENRLRQAFVLENGKIAVKIDTSGFMEIKGTAQNDLLQTYQNKKNDFYKKTELFFKSQKISIKSADEELALAKKQEELNKLEVNIDKEYASKHVNSIIGTHIFTNSFFNMTIFEKEGIIKLMSHETKNIKRIQEIITDIDTEKKVMVGSLYTDFSLPGLAGGNIALSDLVGKSDYVLVDFWASWCGPCIRSLPELKTIYEKHKGLRFEILGVSLDDDRNNWSGAVSSHQLGWKHCSDLKGWKCEGSRIYAVNSIPCTFLINKKGEIVGHNLSISEIEKLLHDKVAKN